MKPFVSPHVVALLIFTSFSPLGAEIVSKPTAPSSPSRTETSSARSIVPPAAISGTSVRIPRAKPVITATPAAKPTIHLDVRREPVSIHPITVKNGPQPYVVDPDSLQKGLALISKLYRKSGNR